jgi:integrase/recombinase XerD
MVSENKPSLDVLIDQYLNYLLVEKGLSKHTLDSYSRDLTRYHRFLRKHGVMSVSESDTAHILKHLITLRNSGLGARSRARHLVALRGFYRFLVQEEVIYRDPSRLVELPKISLKLPDVLSVDEVMRLLDTPDLQTHRGARDAAMLEILYAAGLRVSELVNLKLRDVNWEAGYVRVLGKGSKERIVPIGLYAQKKIQHYLNHNRKALIKNKTSPYLFVARADPPGILETYQELCSESKIAKKNHTTQPQTLICHPSAGRWRGLKSRANHVGPCGYFHHTNLHPYCPRPP